LGGCRRWSAGFGGVFCSVRLDELFGLLRSQKNVKFSNMLGVRQRSPNWTKEGRISHKYAPRKPSAPRTICSLIFFCSNHCNYLCAKSFLVLWAVVSCFVNALQVLEWFQGLSTSPFLLVWGVVCLCFVRSLPYTMIYREGTCFEDLHICQQI
jgi:hypothetical protein